MVSSIFLLLIGGRFVSIEKISIRQIKAARELLGWTQDELAEASGVSSPTIARLEAEDDGQLGGRPETGEKIRRALEKAGIEFTNGDGLGVRLKKRRR
jgi:transcriptional regulator with XRE-family HTH domain